MTNQRNRKYIHHDNSRREITSGEAVEAAIALSKEEGPIWEYGTGKNFFTRKTIKKTASFQSSQEK